MWPKIPNWTKPSFATRQQPALTARRRGSAGGAVRVREEEIGSPENPSPSRGPGTVLSGELGRSRARVPGPREWALGAERGEDPEPARQPPREPAGRAARESERDARPPLAHLAGPRARALRDGRSERRAGARRPRRGPGTAAWDPTPTLGASFPRVWRRKESGAADVGLLPPGLKGPGSP